MYNNDLKMRFMQSYKTSETTKHILKGFFRTTEKLETELGKDLCVMSPHELEKLVDLFAGFRSSSEAISWLRFLRVYVSWCVSEHVLGATDIACHLKFDQSSRMLRFMVSGPQHLMSVLNEILRPATECSTDDISAVYMWLAFSGLPHESVETLTVESVDLDRKIINYLGRVYPLYKESLPVFDNCVNTTSFSVMHKGKTFIWKRALGNELLRGIKGPAKITKLHATFYKLMSRVRDEQEGLPELSYTRVWFSGVFYRIHERELAGFPAIFSVSSENDDIFQYLELSKGEESTSHKEQVWRRFKHDYQTWLHAFNLQE